jgi:hypothetical protein
LCRKPRFMYVQRPGDRTEIQPTMVGPTSHAPLCVQVHACTCATCT